MKILVNDIAASSGGAMLILNSFYKFANNDKKNKYIFLLSNTYFKETDNIRIITRPDDKKWLKRLKFDLIKGKKLVKMIKPDAIISLQNTAIFGTKVKQILYVHQAIPFQNSKKFSLLKKNERKLAIIQYFIGYLIKKSIKKANHVIVQTYWMKERIIEKTKISENQISILLPEINLELKKSKIHLNNNNFFYPANNAIYKNHTCIYKACEILNKENIEEYKVYLTVEKQNDIQQIIFLGLIDYEETLKKYNETVLIFPSFIETVGLPLLEAKKSGTIILASDTEFSKEILNDYNNAYFFNPFKPEELANLMKRCIEGEIKLKECDDDIKEKNIGWEIINEILKEKK